MITIYKAFIEKNICNLKKEHISEFAKSQNEILSETETNILYNFIKSNYKELLNKNTQSFIQLKQILRKDLFIKIEQLYNDYSKYV